MTRTRSLLRAPLPGPLPPAPLPAGLLERAPAPDDAQALGRLIFDAYHGTIDDEGETPEEAVGVAAHLLGGGFGEVIRSASALVIAPDGRLIAATLVTWHRMPTGQFEGPFLAFSLTDPAWQRRGLARAGLARAMHALAADARAHREIALIVTQGNPAEHLYAALGFR